ncbi:MAG: sugar transferase [Desulfobacterales bacterium]|nr:MAG: sugar transferase [Desulfobacterales bacterium]
MRNKLLNFGVNVGYPIIDFIVITAGILLSYKIYRILGIGQNVYYQSSQLFPFSLMAAGITIICMGGFGVYKKESSILNVEEIKNCIKGITFSFFILSLILVFGKINLSRYTLIFSFVLCVIATVAEKMIFYNILPSFAPLQGYHKRVLIYGAGELGKALFRSLANSPKMRIIPVGFIDDDPSKSDMVCYQSGFNCKHCLRVIGTRADIQRLKEEYGINEIFIAISNIKDKHLRELLDYLKQQRIEASFVPNLHEAFLHKVTIKKIGDLPIVKEIDFYHRPLYIVVKRYMDFILAAFLLTLLWPLFAVIAVAIKLDSKGSVIFKQTRVGKEGKIFQIYKFRSMFAETDAHAINPVDFKDPRITRVGRFLRKTSLDELPQIINVLKGEMSFVGPRPEMPFIAEKYDGIQKERLTVLPGITGLWQLSGDRSKAIHENMDYDLYYIRNVSFFLDVAILIQTTFFAFKGI